MTEKRRLAAMLTADVAGSRLTATEAPAPCPLFRRAYSWLQWRPAIAEDYATRALGLGPFDPLAWMADEALGSCGPSGESR
jgi:hypothetical protein